MTREEYEKLKLCRDKVSLLQDDELDMDRYFTESGKPSDIAGWCSAWFVDEIEGYGKEGHLGIRHRRTNRFNANAFADLFGITVRESEDIILGLDLTRTQVLAKLDALLARYGENHARATG